MVTVRRITQLVFLGFFVYLIIRTVDPLTSSIPANLFFISNPLVAIGVTIATQKFLLEFLAALVIIIITVFLGRVFCGWACPFGTTIDIFDRFISLTTGKLFKWDTTWGIPLWRQGLGIGWRRLKYIILVSLLVAAVLGVNAIGWLDPISLSFKGYALLLYSALDWAGKGILAAVGLGQGVTPLIDIGILDRNNIFFKSSFILAIIIIGILLLGLIERRFWCRNLCPLGALLGLLSKWRLVRTSIGADCNECQYCVKACKMGARTKELVALDEECIHCYTCVDGCPSEQLYFRKTATRLRRAVLPSRRGFLIATLAGVASLPLLKYSILADKKIVLPRLRPPGGVNKDNSEEKFLAKCVRCGECMKVCPNNALHPVVWEGGVYGMFSPYLIPSIGYCLYECNLCGQVCPTGAIKNLALDDKKLWKMGAADVDRKICINCLACEEHCPVPDKAIKVDIDRSNGKKYPLVMDEMCIGCGACENSCPASPVKAIRVYT